MADSSSSEPPAAAAAAAVPSPEAQEIDDGPPPGFSADDAGTHAVEESVVESLSRAIESTEVTADVPDPAAALVEEEATEIKTVLAPDATPYSSAKTFEELNLSPELLTVRRREPPPPALATLGAA